ncbi:hypothetical protein F4810DRAFT_694171 [Camillea tinctor]|nr:hypothetical protein F4810DRAFT_694171 [Camillea tinctor]
MKVAALDMRHHKFLAVDEEVVACRPCRIVDLPRWNPKCKVYVPNPVIQNGNVLEAIPGTKGMEGKNYLGIVNIWSLGVGYNINRAINGNRKLYVFNE